MDANNSPLVIRNNIQSDNLPSGKEAVQNVSNELQAALHELTPKRSGKTTAAWRQTKNDDGSITIHTRLKNKKGEQPVRWILELNEGGYKTRDGGIAPPTKFIETSIARGLSKAHD